LLTGVLIGRLRRAVLGLYLLIVVQCDKITLVRSRNSRFSTGGHSTLIASTKPKVLNK
jgi:hypothetical protein